MVSVNGYFDGNVVKPLEKIDAKPNQRVIITIMDEFFTPEPKKDIKSMRGVLAQYADPELAKKEKEARKPGNALWSKNMILCYLLN